jgi:hypothetical protein
MVIGSDLNYSDQGHFTVHRPTLKDADYGPWQMFFLVIWLDLPPAVVERQKPGPEQCSGKRRLGEEMTEEHASGAKAPGGFCLVGCRD